MNAPDPASGVPREDAPDALLAVLLGESGSLTPVQIAGAAEDTVRVRFVVDSGAVHDGLAMVAEALAPTVRVDFTDLDACRRAVAGADAVTTFVDGLCPLAALLSGTPGLWGRKDLQRRVLHGAGVSRVRSAALRDEASLRRFAAQAGRPFVVKPADGVSGRDVWLIHDEPDLDRFLRETATRTADGVVLPTGMFAEQYVTGGPAPAPHLADYVSVELFVTGGRTEAAFVTDRLLPERPCRETGLVLPTSLDPQDQAAVTACATRALRALDTPDGAYHVEAKPRAGHPDIVEVNGRLGGYITRLVRYGTGTDLARTALDAVLSRPVDLGTTWHRAVLVLLFPAPPGAARITAAPTRRELARLPGVLAVDQVAGVGRPVDWRAGAAGTVATVWIGADDHDALRARLADAVALLGERFAYDDSAGRALRDDIWWTRIATTRTST
ncbi:acetyl-CoA carboxylase biotin carboxylase subunit family protein [Streptomyces sp. NPDC048291]|uniref:ATP-grasp domain-containing protein n=1 Tax=Streptomyces sp. NPDC048291 TaxID=3365530 RepID=UPI003721AA1E